MIYTDTRVHDFLVTILRYNVHFRKIYLTALIKYPGHIPMPMRTILLSICLLILLSIQPTQAAPQSNDPGWSPIVTGIDYQVFQLPDPNNVFVTRMDRTNTTLTLESMLSDGRLRGAFETVSSMYTRYDQALNFWGGGSNPPDWGMRNQAVVAINGSYFGKVNGVPQGGQVQSGWYAKRFNDLWGGSGFAWKLDRSTFIGKCVSHWPDRQIIAYPFTAGSQLISAVNTPRGADELVLYTPQYDTRTGTDASGAEVVVEMNRPTMILPAPAYASGYVRQVLPKAGNSLIPFNSIVLSATGSAAQAMLANVQPGGEVRVSQEITSYEDDCETPLSLNWTKTYTSIEGAFYYLENGLIHDYDDPGALSREPRTAIAYNDQYVYFIVVDGRDFKNSIGMSIHQLAQFSRDQLGATFGVAEDGGGSSTMVINGKVVNNTYCNIHVCYIPTYLPLVGREHNQGQEGVSLYGDEAISSAATERPVANGMMMVIAQPAEYSEVFTTTQQVTTTVQTDLRLGPGNNYASITTLPAGSTGEILEQMNGLDGVRAKSSYWWYVDFGGTAGWVPEEALAGRR